MHYDVQYFDSPRDSLQTDSYPVRQPPRWLRRATTMIREEFGSPLTVQGIAREVGVHPVHLSRVFRRVHHRSIGDYLRHVRVQFACDRLCESDVQLADLALSAGFCDQSQLTHSFKKVVGTTPGRYRTQAQTAH